MDFVYTGNYGSSLLAVSMLLSVPHDDGHIMTSPYITKIFDGRLELAQQSTVRAPVLRGEEGVGWGVRVKISFSESLQ
jgi:hypothetical protein